MKTDKLKIILKWAGLLVVVGVVCLMASSFLVGLLGVLIYGRFYNQAQGTFIAAILGMLAVLPFAYLFPYKAALEYLKILPKDKQKNIGVVAGFGVVAVAAVISTSLGFLLTGKLNYSLGFLPILLSILAGYQAERKFLRKK